MYVEETEEGKIYTLKLDDSWNVTNDFTFPDDIVWEEGKEPKQIDVITVAESSSSIKIGDDENTSCSFTVNGNISFTIVRITICKSCSMHVNQDKTMKINGLKLRIYGDENPDKDGVFENKGTFVLTGGASVDCEGQFDSTCDGSNYVDNNDEMTFSSLSVNLQKGSIFKVKNGSNVTVSSEAINVNAEISDSTIGLINYSHKNTKPSSTSIKISNCTMGDDRSLYSRETLMGKNRAGTIILSPKSGETELLIENTILSNLILSPTGGETTCTISKKVSVMGAIVTNFGGSEGALVFEDGCKFTHSLYTVPEGYYLHSQGITSSISFGDVTPTYEEIKKSKSTLTFVETEGSDDFITMWKNALGITDTEMDEMTVPGKEVKLSDKTQINNKGASIITNKGENWNNKLYIMDGSMAQIATISFNNGVVPVNSELFVDIPAGIGDYHISVAGTDFKQFSLKINSISSKPMKIEPSNAAKFIGEGYNEIQLLTDDANFRILPDEPTPPVPPTPPTPPISKYTVSYDVDEGSEPAPKTEICNFGEEITIAFYNGTKDGYVFNGWSYDGGLTVLKPGQTLKVVASMTLTAMWEPSSLFHKVTFDTDGGSDAPETITVEEGLTFKIPEYKGNKDGYAFGGWSYNGKVYNTGDTVTMGGSDIIMKAIWNPVSSDNNTGMIVGIVVGAIVVIALIGGAVYFIKKK